MLSSSVGAWCTVDGTLDTPAFECPVLNYFGFTTKQIDFCADWSCTTTFNAFTGSQLIAINDSGTIDGADGIAVNLPTSGTYGYIRILVNNDFLMNGYGKKNSDWCVTGTTTVYATEALAKAAATDTNFSFKLDKFFKLGNGVDAIGDMWYGYGAGQNNVPGYSTGNSISAVNEYTTIYSVDSGQNDDFSFTTVLQGDYDFGSGKLPSTINFGITVTKYGSIAVTLADESAVAWGKSLTAHGGCIVYPSGFVWDFVIS